MTSRAVTIAGFVVLIALAAGLVVLSRLRPDRLARFVVVVRAVSQRNLILRGLVLFCWAWLGWHFLARNG
jgi:Family of unknown function (DUF6186)